MSELHFQPIKGKAREILKAILQTPEVSSCSLKDGFQSEGRLCDPLGL